MEELVSVIIPVYNRQRTILKAIKSVLEQTYRNIEIIVVDDGSTDNTALTVRKCTDSRIRYLKNHRRLGANGARNVGIQNALGDYIAFQDSDDIWKNDKLEKQMKLFGDRKELDIVYSRYIRHWTSGENDLVPDKRYTKKMLQDEIACTLAKLNVIGTPTMIVKRKCFDEYGIFDLEVSRFQDWEINIGFVQRYKYGFIDEALVDAYVSADSITNIAKSSLESMTYIIKKHRKFFEAQGTMDIQLTKLVKNAWMERRMKELQILLGEELFFRSIYANETKQENLKKNYDFLYEWMRREKNSSLANSFFARYADASMALYGYGDIGKLLLNTLTESNKRKIKYIIDKNTDSETKYKMLSADMLKAEDFKGIDCIVITAVAHEKEIREKLGKIVTVSVISVYDMIKE